MTEPQWPVISPSWKYITSIGRLDIHRFIAHTFPWFVVVWGEVTRKPSMGGYTDPFLGLGWDNPEKLTISKEDDWRTLLSEEEQNAVMALVMMEKNR